MLTTYKKIGKKIRDLRKARDWTQEELAENSGLHPTYIGGIERGERNPTLGSLYKISSAFGISLSNILKLEGHELEKLFNAPSDDILLSIFSGFRAQVDVKGKLAELYLSKYLESLKQSNKIENYEWHDKDSLPDFVVFYKEHRFIIECKNLRSGNEGIYRKEPSYKVEVQKTRNSKDGSNTRSYPVDYFDILAVCMFNQTKIWEFFLIAAKYLKKAHDNSFLAVFQPVPFNPCSPWEKNIITVMDDILRDRQ
jgi:transcriptional regulator with XRE-family HTH domain